MLLVRKPCTPHPFLHPQGPCVLFATPGMLHGGASLEAFKAWAGNPLNLVILPGYQVGIQKEDDRQFHKPVVVTCLEIGIMPDSVYAPGVRSDCDASPLGSSLSLPGWGDIGQSLGQHRRLHVQRRGNSPPGRQVNETRGSLPGQSRSLSPPQPLMPHTVMRCPGFLPSLNRTFLPLPSGAVPLVQCSCRCQGHPAGSKAMWTPSVRCARSWRGLADGVHEGEDQEVREWECVWT